MANREVLGIIKGARAGDKARQLLLGKLYLFGDAGLPESLPTALHWLQRAAAQQCPDAKLLIGHHVPFDMARNHGAALLPCYRLAYEQGMTAAGLVLAQLVLGGDAGQCDAALTGVALQALDAAARAGLPDALWLLARHGGAAPGVSACTFLPEGQAWLTRAADSGVGEAVHAVLQQAWDACDWPMYLQRALPRARALLADSATVGHGKRTTQHPLPAHDLLLLSRCGQALALAAPQQPQAEEALRFFELAASGGERAAQLALGLLFARMDLQGARLPDTGCTADTARRGVNRGVNFKRAIRWLTQAGEQGLADAWFALSRIYIKPEFSQRSLAESQSCLERAAAMGHASAQLECGIQAWRNRRDDDNNDVRAAYWLLKAAMQGNAEADSLLLKIAPQACVADWGQDLGADAALQLAARTPLLAARLELARCLRLTRAEALLLDVAAADRGHCLVVDIRASHGRGKRRLVLLRTAQQRQLVERVARLFERVDCGPDGPEGNYRQRLYRLKTCVPDACLLAA